MKGYPKNLNTKFDYLYVKENFKRELWEKDFQNLLDTRMVGSLLRTWTLRKRDLMIALIRLLRMNLRN